MRPTKHMQKLIDLYHRKGAILHLTRTGTSPHYTYRIRMTYNGVHVHTTVRNFSLEGTLTVVFRHCSTQQPRCHACHRPL